MSLLRRKHAAPATVEADAVISVKGVQSNIFVTHAEHAVRAKLPVEEATQMAEKLYSVAMTTYRVFAVDGLDKVMSVQEIECTDDGGAMEIAKSLLTDGLGIEVWDVGRRVC